MFTITRTKAAILFSIILIIEMFYFYGEPMIVKKTGESTGGLFSVDETAIDYAASMYRTEKMKIVIMTTAFISFLVTYSLPSKK